MSYNTVTEANTYVTNHFLSDDPLRVAWEALSNENKTVLLTKSFEAIETLPLRGRTTSYDQLTAFPRWPDTTVPTTIKAAEVENAIAFCSTSDADEAELYQKMWKYGITSYTNGTLSESIDPTVGTAGGQFSYGIVSEKAMQLLKSFMGGAYTIRGL